MIARTCSVCAVTLPHDVDCCYAHPRAAISVADTHYSYLPADVGFDLRLHGDTVNVPRDATSASFLVGGEPARIEGNAEVLATRMREAGYRAEVGR